MWFPFACKECLKLSTEKKNGDMRAENKAQANLLKFMSPPQ